MLTENKGVMVVEEFGSYVSVVVGRRDVVCDLRRGVRHEPMAWFFAWRMIHS